MIVVLSVFLLLIFLLIIWVAARGTESTSPQTPPPQETVPMPFSIPPQFMLQASGGDYCLDDGGGTEAGKSEFIKYQCNKTNKNQQFSYDATTQLLRNINKNGLCLDNNGVNTWLWNCDQGNKNQTWTLSGDSRGVKLTNVNKPGMCLEADPNGQNFSKISMKPCSDSVGQLFSFVNF